MARNRRQWVALLPAAALVVASATTVVAQDERAYEGVEINVVTFTGPPIYEPLQRYAGPWSEETGAQINFTQFPFSDLYQRALTDVASGTNSFDLMTLAAPWLGDFAAGGYLEDLSDRVVADPELEWDDVAPYFRDFVASYGGKVQGIVIDGDHLMVYYRSDILGDAGVEPPNTWDEYLTIAEQFDGQDLNGDGDPDFGSCVSKARGGVGTWQFNGVFAPYLQTQGTSQGAFFGEGMVPLVNNEGMAKALEFWKDSSEFGPPDEINLDQEAGRAMFASGRCALFIDWGDMGVLAIDPEYSSVVDKVGVVAMPGTSEVVDRETGMLVPCDETICPYMDEMGLNRAPFAAFGGWAGVINEAADQQVKDAAFDFLSYVSDPERSNMDVTIGRTGMNPYRISQVNDLGPWTEAGFSEEAAEQYLGAIQSTLENPNMVLDLRVGQANNYTNVLEDTAIAQYLAGELTVEQAMQQIEDQWQELTDQIGRDAQQEAYDASLGVVRELE